MMRNDDQTKGNWDQVKGEAKKQFGKLTDNESMEAEGRMDKGKGKVREAFGDAKENVSRAFNDSQRD
ncbi:CsbD family protein [Bacillus sp. FJAT-27251]|uniref:CsbD family protein n=1 Tax=Bacillus sp. FJAT-27251 TaxID=1684142 RepID=UPI000A4F195A|nr:CsbD family protein [Bacillus sp. FJAT-27251]